MAVSTVPVLVLGLWIETTAYRREVEEVRERHLLIARNMTLALERYATDAAGVLGMFGDLVEREASLESLPALGARLGYVYFCTLHADGTATDHVVMDRSRTVALTDEQLRTFWALAGEPGVAFSGIGPDIDGVPTIFTVRGLSGGRMVVGALSTDYLRAMQESIAFGVRGHAAIVDQYGRVIAHPDPDWVATSKDISPLGPVRQMMAGETGVAEFFSPAMQADMIAGLTQVPRTGWGVMVPQPIEELQEAAAAVKVRAVLVAVAGLLGAGVLSWLLAGMLMRPVADVIGAALRLADGDLTARARAPSGNAPAELATLAGCFNQMAVEIEEDHRALAAALQDARLGERAKSEFLATVSHELRTPLNAVIGFSELIEGEAFGTVGDARYREYAGNIRRSGEHLRDVINDILDFSAVQAADWPLEADDCDLAALMRGVAAMMEGQARTAGLDLRDEIAADLGTIRTNPRRLRQILLNLLSNAIKFTEPGGRVTLTACRLPQGIAISVADTGIGMDPDQVPVALMPFRQLEPALTRRREGTGLGLPLSRSFAERLGGSLTIDTRLGEGTTVTVVLPPEPPSETAAPA